MKVIQGGKIIDVNPHAEPVYAGPAAEPEPATVDYTETDVDDDEAADDTDDDEPVPDGTIADILAWVGDDPARTARALAAELDRPSPRKTLVDRLVG